MEKKFFDLVLGKTVLIPKGKVTTYGLLAKALGRPKAARAVGSALGKNPNPVEVPCHRVIRADGSIGGYSRGRRAKKKLFKKEGIRFLGDKVVDFNERLFNFKKRV